MVVAVVVGAQWGDEGKGKIVDVLAEKADVVIRFNGGDNAGHTVAFKDKKYKMHQLPSGAFHSGKQVIIGCGCVVNPKTLLEELDLLEKDGIKPNLLIDARAHVILPYHIALDGLEEASKGRRAAGTTRRGIGPCYSDKAARLGMRFADFLDEKAFKEKLHLLHEIKVKMIKEVYGGEFAQSEEEIFAAYARYAERLRGFIGDGCAAANEAVRKNKHVLLEGAQGTLLSIDHGVYPYGTSSNPTSGGASTGSGIAPNMIKEVIGVIKAYTSRVGEGPLPTEITDETAKRIRDKGWEYGTTTGRPRRIGWLDLVALKYAHEINGFTGLAFTRIDTLAGISPLKVCVAYELDGKRITQMPISPEEIARCKPIYEELPGWSEMEPEEWRKISIRGMFALPNEARNYLKMVSEFLNVPIYMVSVGAGREDTIAIKDVFTK